MKEAVLPIPVSHIKQEPQDEGRDPSVPKSVSVEPDVERERTFAELSVGDALSQDGKMPGASTLDRITNDRSDQLSNESDSGDVILRDDGELGSKSDFKYECPICQARFKSARAFRGHGIVHRFGSPADVRGHLGQMDSGQCSLQYSPKRLGFESSSFKCDGCQTVFNSRDTYAMHMMMRAKDENCRGLLKECKHQLLMGEVADRAGPASDSQLETQAALRQNLWNLQLLQKGRTDGKLVDYHHVIPDLIPSPGGSRELIVCRICGELFQNKDSLAMHMMFHTRTEAENSRRGWTVIYSSAMSELGENPEDLIANHELVPIDDSSLESLDSVPHVENQPEVPYSEGVSDDPCYSDETNEGLDLSMASKVNGIKDDNSADTIEGPISKAPNWLGIHDGKRMELSDTACMVKGPEDISRNPTDVQERMFCFQYAPSQTPTQMARSRSADVTMPRRPEIGEQRDINIIKCLTENPARVAHGAENGVSVPEQVRSKSVDVVMMRRNDRHVAALPITAGKTRKLRKSRVPTRKYPFGSPYRTLRHPEVRKSPTLQKQPEPLNGACAEGDRNIVDFLATNTKDLSYCKYCEIIYLDRTLYQLHMGLHNVNNPWQCNACGRVCANRLQFSSHVLHY